jgi:hypothetical protein
MSQKCITQRRCILSTFGAITATLENTIRNEKGNGKQLTLNDTKTSPSHHLFGFTVTILEGNDNF